MKNVRYEIAIKENKMIKSHIVRFQVSAVRHKVAVLRNKAAITGKSSNCGIMGCVIITRYMTRYV